MRYGIENALSSRLNDDSQKVYSYTRCNAYEISLHANNTYSHNFTESISKKNKNDTPFSVQTKLIEQLKPHDIDNLGINLWTMSPPCQPFTNTKNAKQRDSDDERCKGLKAIIQLLKAIKQKPKWIILENVKNFVGSHMLALWQECLMECEYSFEEYLLSPTQFGIPNHRTRFYMICERSERFQNRKICHDNLSLSFLPGTSQMDVAISPLLVGNFIDKNLDMEERKKLIIPNDTFDKPWIKNLGIVSPLDEITHCFTAFYGRQLHRATGSVLLEDETRSQSIATLPLDRTNMSQYKGKLRRFSPKELLSLFGFPPEFSFPEDISLEHRYKLIGNSVNVSVVSFVASYLLQDICKHPNRK